MKEIVRRVLRGFGFEIRRISKVGWHPEHLRKLGFSPRTVIDVGVGNGTWPLYRAYPEATFVLVEPLREFEPAMKRVLEAHPGRYFLTAVGEREETKVIHVEPDILQKSSLMDRTAFSATGSRVEERPIPVTTLDRLMEEHSFQPPFGLKIDTEGFEMDVIRGAGKLLTGTQFVIAEVSISSRFEGGYRVADLISEMDARGFEVCDVLEVCRSWATSQASFLDAVFRRKKEKA